MTDPNTTPDSHDLAILDKHGALSDELAALLPEDARKAWYHLTSMQCHRGDGIPTQNTYPKEVRDAAVALVRAALAPRQPDQAEPIIADILAEVASAIDKFPTWPTRIIDAGNVVSEEAGELSKACLQRVYEKEKCSIEDVREEAIQTAAMCIRFLASLHLYDMTPGPQHPQPAELFDNG